MSKDDTRMSGNFDFRSEFSGFLDTNLIFKFFSHVMAHMSHMNCKRLYSKYIGIPLGITCLFQTSLTFSLYFRLELSALVTRTLRCSPVKREILFAYKQLLDTIYRLNITKSETSHIYNSLRNDQLH